MFFFHCPGSGFWMYFVANLFPLLFLPTAFATFQKLSTSKKHHDIRSRLGPRLSSLLLLDHILQALFENTVPTFPRSTARSFLLPSQCGPAVSSVFVLVLVAGAPSTVSRAAMQLHHSFYKCSAKVSGPYVNVSLGYND